MRDDRTDLRMDPTVRKDRSLPMAISMVVSLFMIVAGLTMAVLPMISGGDDEPMGSVDNRPYIVLSSTLDRVTSGESIYIDLPVSDALYLALRGDIVLDEVVRTIIIEMAEFLYPNLALTIIATYPGLGELTILMGGTGTTVDATVPVGDGTLTLSISHSEAGP